MIDSKQPREVEQLLNQLLTTTTNKTQRRHPQTSLTKFWEHKLEKEEKIFNNIKG